MNGLYLYGVGLPLAMWLAALALVLWLAARFGGRRFVWGMSGLAGAILVLLVGDVLVGCSAPPVWIAPTDGDPGGDGQMIFPCDAGLGVLARLTIYITAPLALLGQAILTWWMLDKAHQG